MRKPPVPCEANAGVVDEDVGPEGMRAAAPAWMLRDPGRGRPYPASRVCVCGCVCRSLPLSVPPFPVCLGWKVLLGCCPLLPLEEGGGVSTDAVCPCPSVCPCPGGRRLSHVLFHSECMIESAFVQLPRLNSSSAYIGCIGYIQCIHSVFILHMHCTYIKFKKYERDTVNSLLP